MTNSISTASTAGFYKFNGNILSYASDSVYAPNYTLLSQNREAETFPVDGWRWFDSRDQATTFYGINREHAQKYQNFYNGLIASHVYTDVINTPGKTGDEALAAAVFASAIQAAMFGPENPPAVQSAIWFLMANFQTRMTANGLAEIQQLLNENNMGELYSLTPPPPAREIGQAWTDANGQSWIVAQARDENGQFVADDLTTPQRESLRWVQVSIPQP